MDCHRWLGPAQSIFLGPEMKRLQNVEGRKEVEIRPSKLQSFRPTRFRPTNWFSQLLTSCMVEGQHLPAATSAPPTSAAALSTLSVRQSTQDHQRGTHDKSIQFCHCTEGKCATCNSSDYRCKRQEWFRRFCGYPSRSIRGLSCHLSPSLPERPSEQRPCHWLFLCYPVKTVTVAACCNAEEK